MKSYKLIHSLLFLLLVSITISGSRFGAEDPAKNIPKLENPISVEYLKTHLRKEKPRLVLNDQTANVLIRALKENAAVKNMYEAVAMNAASILEKPLLERKVVGRRLLGTSREFLWRINMLGMVYFVEKDNRILDRINEEVIAVSQFSDWNPSHFLDVAEMALGVSLALDWTSDELPEATRALAITALIEKGLKPSWDGDGKPRWAYGTNNWNQVCNGGMIAAAIAVAEVEPELAAKTIHRALDGLPHSLIEYGPDGVYPEGSTYWSYGTSFSVITIALLESAFGTDFGMGEYPAFQESAVFRVLCNAPTGWYYNFADCGDRRSQNGDLTLAWFAAKSGDMAYFEEERFLRAPREMGKLSRLSGAALVWLAQFQQDGTSSIPSAWKGEGANPIIIFTSNTGNQDQFYLGAKGGRGTVNHGNMDAGSFVFELDGVRWVIDPGNQPYHELEKTGFDLWGRCQDCERWTLLTKNNYGHSTLTVNDQLHVVDGMVNLVSFDETVPKATFEMTPAFTGLLEGANRTFTKDGDRALLIEDVIVSNKNTERITWQLMTQAEVEVVAGGVLLSQQGKKISLKNLSHPDKKASVLNLDPPPHELDRKIPNLKRIEYVYSKADTKDEELSIKIKLEG